MFTAVIWRLTGTLAALSGPALADDTAWAPTGYRVDAPDHPDALISSPWGSVLAAPPTDGTPWRVEMPPEVDEAVDGYSTWEALDALDAAAWHDAGWRGQGVKIAVFDLQYEGHELYAGELGDYRTHDCWEHDYCTPDIDGLRPHSGSETGVHGIACGEVIRDIAPEAELHLVRVNGLTTFENAAEWVAREGIDLASMSLSFFSNSFYDGTGPVSDVGARMARDGVLLVTSAGNYAEGHWLEDFRDVDGDGLHEFPWGSEYLPIELSGGGSRKIVLEWDQYTNCGDTDFDIRVYASDARLVGSSSSEQDPDSASCEPVERASANADEDGWYYLQIERVRGDPATRFGVFANSGEVYQRSPEGSVVDPGSHPDVFTIGAVRGDGYMQNEAENFSSHGPTRAGMLKPDIAGPDGLTSASYGTTNFYGTSAATPAVAAAIALVMSRDPELSAFEAAELLRGWAASESATWEPPDYALGAGRARLPDPSASGLGCSRRRPWYFGWILLIPWRRRARPSGRRGLEETP